MNLDDGSALMAYPFRRKDTTARTDALFAYASPRDRSGTRNFASAEVVFEPIEHWTSPRTRARYPVAMRVRVGERVFETRPLMPARPRCMRPPRWPWLPSKHSSTWQRTPLHIKFVYFRIEMPDAVAVQRCRRPPLHWRAEPPELESMRYGSKWLRAGRTAVLEVPSAIVPSEKNYLLNPGHADFRRLRLGRPLPFVLDPRMWK